MIEQIWKHLVGPVVADAKNVEEVMWQGATAQPGYNPVNTVTYAFLALTTLYLVYKFIKSRDVDITVQTAVNTVSFILLGGTLRFLDDAQIIPYPYSISLITPIIYFLVMGLYLPAVYKLNQKQLRNFGTALLLPTLAYTVLTVDVVNYLYVLLVVGLTAILTAIYYFIANEELKENCFTLLAFTQFFEGSASMFSTYYEYQPKQILAQTFNSLFGAPGILIIKIGILILGLKVINDLEDVKLKALALITLYSVGLGTGFRVFLRVATGT